MNTPHDVALAILVDHKGLVLLQQKTYDAPHFPGVWSLFGGHREGDETALETIMREYRRRTLLNTQAFSFYTF